MKVVFDSSAFAKRYIAETGSQSVDELCQSAGSLGLCVLCIPEIFSAFNRRLRERAISPADYKIVKAHFMADIEDAAIFDLTSAAIALSVSLLEQNTLRAMDALHIACAHEWKADLFVTSDQRQLRAAQALGLNAQLV